MTETSSKVPLELGGAPLARHSPPLAGQGVRPAPALPATSAPQVDPYRPSNLSVVYLDGLGAGIAPDSDYWDH